MSSNKDYRPCHRCGRRTAYNRKAKVSGVCIDCRQADPAFVAALRSGVPLLEARTC